MFKFITIDPCKQIEQGSISHPYDVRQVAKTNFGHIFTNNGEYFLSWEGPEFYVDNSLEGLSIEEMKAMTYS